MRYRKPILIIVAVVVAVAAITLTRQHAPESDITKTTLYPGLIDHLNNVEQLEVRSRDKHSVLRRQGERWTMHNRDDFPARFDDVKRGLIQLAMLEVVEAKTSKPERYARIGVEDVETEDSTSRLVTVSGAAGTPYVSLIVGKQKKLGSAVAHYVRRRDDAEALLVEGELELSPDPNQWIETAIADISAKRIHRLRIQPLEGDPVVIHKASPDDNFFELENVPDGYTVKSQAAVSSLGALFLDLRFADVAAASALGPDAVPKTIVAAETFEGLLATIEQFEHGDRVFARFSYEFNPDVVREIAAAHPPAAAADIADAPAPADAAADAAPPVEAQVKTLNETAAGWVFVLPDYKIRMIDKRMEDLIKVYEPPPPPLEPESPE